METTGLLEVKAVGGRSTVARCFAKYPLKFLVPRKAACSKVDAVWIYAISYGGGIVSGDCIKCEINVADGCTAVFTTQASTKVYKSKRLECSVQVLEARIGRGSLLALVPHPVTCFSTARYCQTQLFNIDVDSNLLLVDWLTSGRRESGEKWDFDFYKSTNNVFLQDGQPLFLDSVLLQQEGGKLGIAERMQDYQVIAMVVLIGPKLTDIQGQLQEEVKNYMSEYFRYPNRIGRSKNVPEKPPLVASCSSFGHKGVGMVVRIAALTTELVYEFLRLHLAGMEQLLAIPIQAALAGSNAADIIMDWQEGDQSNLGRHTSRSTSFPVLILTSILSKFYV
ncbi:urease accessory protein D isoform X2 [Wolffia australiana]